MSTCQGALGAALHLNPAHWTLTVECESNNRGAFVTPGPGASSTGKQTLHTHVKTHLLSIQLCRVSEILRRSRNRCVPWVNIGRSGVEKAEPSWGLWLRWMGANYDCCVVPPVSGSRPVSLSCLQGLDVEQLWSKKPSRGMGRKKSVPQTSKSLWSSKLASEI